MRLWKTLQSIDRFDLAVRNSYVVGVTTKDQINAMLDDDMTVKLSIMFEEWDASGMDSDLFERLVYEMGRKQNDDATIRMLKYLSEN